MIFELTYIKPIKISDNIENDAVEFLILNDKEKTAIHCKEVADMCDKIACQYGLDRNIATLTGVLHDISAVVKPLDMMQYAQNNNWMIDESEKKYHFILHQRISTEIARNDFGIHDKIVLSAIECHSTLKPNPSQYDMILFLADKISWDQEGHPPFYNILMEALQISLIKPSLAYINFILDNNLILYPHKWLIEAKKWLEERC